MIQPIETQRKLGLEDQLPPNLKKFEEDLEERGIEFPISGASAATLLDVRGALWLIKWARAYKIVSPIALPKEDRRQKYRNIKYWYGLDEVLILEQIVGINQIFPQLKKQPEAFYNFLRASLKDARLAKLIGKPTETIPVEIGSNGPQPVSEEKPKRYRHKEIPEDKLLLESPWSSSEIEEIGDIDIYLMNKLKLETRNWEKDAPLKRQWVIRQLTNAGFDYAEVLADTMVFLTGAIKKPEGKPKSYADCTQDDFYKTAVWCVEKMEETDFTLYEIIKLIENKMHEIREKATQAMADAHGVD